MNETIDFTEVPGKIRNHDIVLYALSTCGFCRRAIEFLKNRDVAFRYIYVDNLDEKVRRMVKTELAQKFKERVMYPYTVVDDEKVLSGFIEPDWKLTLGLE